jgi:hypothetical protein
MVSSKGIALPVIGTDVCNDAFYGRCCIVPRFARGSAAVTGWKVNAPAVRVEQYLIRVKAKPPLRVERTGHSIGIKLSRGDPGHKDMPVVVGAIGPSIQFDNPGWFRGIDRIEEKQLYRLTPFGKDAEVHAVPKDRGAEGIAPAAAGGRFFLRRPPLVCRFP